MDESLVTKVIADLDRITKKIEEIQVMCKVEKKEPRKLWQVINTMAQLSSAHPTGEVYWRQLSSAAIDAVIECYTEWDHDERNKTFPEYLKEKLL